jgi:hypothetical protein
MPSRDPTLLAADDWPLRGLFGGTISRPLPRTRAIRRRRRMWPITEKAIMVVAIIKYAAGSRISINVIQSELAASL